MEKDQLHKLLTEISDNGREGAIPTFIAEVLSSHQFKYNDTSDMIRNTIYHLQRHLQAHQSKN